MKILDLGSGKFKVSVKYLNFYLKNWIKIPNNAKIVTVDKYLDADIIYDLEKVPWKFAKSREYDVVFASHVLEHFDNLVEVMREIHRILNDGGVLFARVPHFKNFSSFRDPTHKHFVTWETFEYFGLSSKFYIDSDFILKS
jgi:predicted SAM-dependent methyltransferase